MYPKGSMKPDDRADAELGGAAGDLPRSELKRIRDQYIDKYLTKYLPERGES